MRGENVLNVVPHAAKRGTSPRARGKLGASSQNFLRMRNIPACAGKTRFTSTTARRLPEHPRVRGENTPRVAAVGAAIGTSPRARGKPTEQLESAERKRNIPACAGKTSL